MAVTISPGLNKEPTRLAYLVGHYPGVSLTFILREVLILRQNGLLVDTASINAAEPSQDGFTDLEQKEQISTFYIKNERLIKIARDHAFVLLRRPFAYLRGLAYAAWLGGFEPRSLAFHLVYFAESVVLGEWMRRRSLSHVHVHFANNTATVALLASKVFPIQYSISVHGPNEFYGVELYRLREKIQGALFLCCIGHFCRSQVMRISSPSDWAKFHVVPLGVDPDVFKPHLEKPGTTEVSIICVGRLVPEKGQAVLLQAFASVVQRGRCARLHLVGSGPSVKSLTRLAADLGVSKWVTFHGSVNQIRVRELLATADIFALPSFAEGIPVALMEAMSAEVPCISTFVGGIPELIESGCDGVLVPPSDVGMLADALDRLISDPHHRLLLGRAARQKVIRLYNLGANVRRLATIFIANIQSSPSRTRNTDVQI